MKPRYLDIWYCNSLHIYTTIPHKRKNGCQFCILIAPKILYSKVDNFITSIEKLSSRKVDKPFITDNYKKLKEMQNEI